MEALGFNELSYEIIILANSVNLALILPLDVPLKVEIVLWTGLERANRAAIRGFRKIVAVESNVVIDSDQ